MRENRESEREREIKEREREHISSPQRNLTLCAAPELTDKGANIITIGYL